MEVGVDGLEVLEGDGFTQQLLVEWQGEAPVQVVAVEDGHAQDTAHEVEVRQVLLEAEAQGR